MKSMRTLVTAMALGLALSACSKTEEGPAEKAGKQIDQAMEDTKEYTQEKIQQAGEAIEEAEKEASQAMSDAKEYSGEKLEDAGETLEKTGEDMQQNN